MLSGLREGLRELPAAARRLIWALTAAAVALATAAVVVQPGGIDPLVVAVIAASIALGEAFSMDVETRRGSSIRFTLGDTALFAALVFAPPGTVAVGAVVGIFAWQVIDQTEPVKLLFNCAQYGLFAATGALALQALTDDPTALEPGTISAVALALLLFVVLNTVSVALIVGLVTGRSPPALAARLLPTNALVTACNGAFAVLLVVVWEHVPYALPAMGAPLALLHLASRARLSEQLQRDRSEALVHAERRLAEATVPRQVAELVVEGTQETLSLAAAVWYRGAWVAGATPGSAPCPTDPEGDLVETRVDELGIADRDARGIAAPFGTGVLVAWHEDASPSDDVTPWLERLARSARVHLDRAEATVALEQERATLQAVVGGTADGILVLDEDGVVQLWNAAMTSLAGTADGVGRPVNDVLGWGPWRTPGIHDVVRTTGDEAEGTIWRVAVASVQDTGVGRLAVGVVHDVTEERRLAQAKDDMLAVVSHELRTPLTPIKASAQLLSRRGHELDDDQRRRMLGQIESRADHLGRLVEDLILVGQLSARGAEPPRVMPATVDLVDVVRAEVERAQQALPEHLVSLDAPANLLGTTDALRLRQIVANLLDNAGKFSPQGGTITVRLVERGEAVLLDVTDEGPGVPPEDRERVFERFERLEDPLRMRTGGAGLGLYIVRALVRALGGDVRIIGARGEGATVRVHLPLLDVTAGPVIVQGQRASTSPSPRLGRD